MARLDEDQRFREARAEELRERDRHREPRSFRRPRRDLAGRSAVRITLVERAAAVQDEGAAAAAPAEATGGGRRNDA
jgi:hypothetical protein